MHINHLDTNWTPILDKQTGVVKAMMALGLSVAGLPGACIQAGSRIPGRDDLRIYARGGPSYASCALVWSGVDLQPQSHLVSDRRIIAKLPTLQSDMWLILVYLPPDNGATGDDEWLAELAGLTKDLAMIGNEGIHPTTHPFILMGNINRQPRSLGGAGCSNKRRQDAWVAFVNQWELHVDNPPLVDEHVHEILLLVHKNRQEFAV